MLRLEDICLKLGDFHLRDIRLHVEPGTYLALLGSTGTGKTVLLETIAGVHTPNSGRIYIRGEDATRLAPEKRRLGIVYQDYALFPHLTVFDNIAFGLKLKGSPGRDIKKAVGGMAAFLEIEPLLERRPGRLSGGERQRVALARALVMEPYVLLLDEPLSALDRATRSRIKRELKRVHKELGVTIIHITHDVSEAFLLSDRLAVMKDGRILQEGAPDEMCRRPGSRSVAELTGIENLIEARVEKGRLVTSMGYADLRQPAAGMDDPPGRVYLTLPGWSIELFPAGSAREYIWQGTLTISDIRPGSGTGIVALTLRHEGGERLKTYLSRRELQAFSASLEPGMRVPVGLLAEGAYCVPHEAPR
ncbi:MAG: ATP-binding cassette domain-containing protein [Syntrophobacteraceae bacterium]|nr:ATP-binding cassette domain-containing protein [Syntrophobacteraceae bacterium]